MNPALGSMITCQRTGCILATARVIATFFKHDSEKSNNNSNSNSPNTSVYHIAITLLDH